MTPPANVNFSRDRRRHCWGDARVALPTGETGTVAAIRALESAELARVSVAMDDGRTLWLHPSALASFNPQRKTTP